MTRGKFSRKKFEEDCLAEYAETFRTVCGDFAFYQFPSRQYWERLFGGTPDSLIIGLKVPEDITVARWPNHVRYGKRAGNANEHFLNAAVFRKLFVEPLQPYSERVGPLIFEFGTMAKGTFATVDHFLDRLVPFLEALPKGPRYAVEIRNPEYLGPAYFTALSSLNVAHVFNAWTRMPELSRQIDMEGAWTADFAVVRALLSHGRTYEAAVKSFEPYRQTQEVNQGARDALKRIVTDCLRRRVPAFTYVNNRLEGNAPSTIEAVVEEF